MNEMQKAECERVTEIAERWITGEIGDGDLVAELRKALLPPEGEARAEPVAWLGVVDQFMGRWHLEVAEPNAPNAFPVYRRPDPEPAPSSEKALREAYEQGLANMSANFPAAKEVIIDRVIDTIYKWSSEHEHQATSPYDWAELGKRLRLLASSPAPRVVEMPGEAPPIVVYDMPAPEAPKEGWTGKDCPQCKGTGIDDPEQDTRACPACGGTGEEYKSERSATT